jgi:polyphosphate kinase 2 (PPK2 family)
MNVNQLRAESCCDKPSRVPIDLADFERGAPFSGDYRAALTALQDRLSLAQLAQIVHGRRAVIVLEGAEASGKKAMLQCLGAGLDPCHYAVHGVAPDRRQASDGHWLAQYWNRLPGVGHTVVFYHSWYRRVLEDRALDLVTEKEWKRGFDEINEFESQQRDYGTLLIKLFFHCTDDVLDQRMADRAAHPWRRHLLGAEELRSAEGRRAYRQALDTMFAQTNTRWAPWTAIDSNDQQAARIAALTVIAEAMEKAIPMQPPEVDEEQVVRLADPRTRVAPA